MSCCGGGGGAGAGNTCNVNTMMQDPCYQKLCCNQRKKVCYKPFIPSYERCEEEVKMGKLLGFDYQRRWFCERNVWLCKVYGLCGGNNQQRSSCQPPSCQPPQPSCCSSPCKQAPCCPSPRLALQQPDSSRPCCQPMKPCPPRCPQMPMFPKVCCPPPCCPDPCIKPSRKCFIPPPCCPPVCCKKMALVVSPPMCPPKCCDLPCVMPDNCKPPRQQSCCGPVCPSPAMIVRPIRNNCCPPPSRPAGNNQCPIPCCNPLPPCCVIVKPCQPKCPPSLCCPPVQTCGTACPQPDSRCCPKPTVVSIKCPSTQRPMQQQSENCPMPISWPSPPRIDNCCPSNCPPKQNGMCFTTVRPMPPRSCPQKSSCGGRGNLRRMPAWHTSSAKTLPWSVDLSVAPLAPISERYKGRMSCIRPTTDSNFWASRFSSRVENASCQMVGVHPEGSVPPCPCHQSC